MAQGHFIVEATYKSKRVQQVQNTRSYQITLIRRLRHKAKKKKNQSFRSRQKHYRTAPWGQCVTIPKHLLGKNVRWWPRRVCGHVTRFNWHSTMSVWRYSRPHKTRVWFRFMLVYITPKYPNHKKIATFFVVLCQVGSTLHHTKSWTRLLYWKVSNFEVEHFRLTIHTEISALFWPTQ